MLRFGSLDKKEIENFNLYLKNQDLLDIVLDPNEIKNLIVFGAGKIAGEIIKKTNFFKNIKNFDIVDSDINKIGTKIFNKEIQSPQALAQDDRKIFIATAQFYDEVYNKIIEIKGNNSNILSGLII